MADFRPLAYNTPRELTSINNPDSVKLLTAVADGTDSSKRILRDIKFSTLAGYVTSNTYGKYSAIGDFYDKSPTQLSNRVVLYPTQENVPYPNFVPGYRLRYLAEEDNSTDSDSIWYDRYTINSSEETDKLLVIAPAQELEEGQIIRESVSGINYSIDEIIDNILVVSEYSGGNDPVLTYEFSVYNGNILTISNTKLLFNNNHYCRSTSKYDLLSNGYYQTSIDDTTGIKDPNWIIRLKSSNLTSNSGITGNLTGIRIYSELSRPITIKLTQYNGDNIISDIDPIQLTLEYNESQNGLFSENIFGSLNSNCDNIKLEIIEVENLGQDYCYIGGIDFQLDNSTWVSISDFQISTETGSESTIILDSGIEDYDVAISNEFLNEPANNNYSLFNYSHDPNISSELNYSDIIINLSDSNSVIGVSITGSGYNKISKVDIAGSNSLSDSWTGIVYQASLDGNDSEILLGNGSLFSYKYYRIRCYEDTSSPKIFDDGVLIDCIGIIYRNSTGEYVVQAKLSKNAVGNDYIGGNTEVYPVYLDVAMTPLEPGNIRGGRIVELSYCEVTNDNLLIINRSSNVTNSSGIVVSAFIIKEGDYIQVNQSSNYYLVTGINSSLNRIYLTSYAGNPTDNTENSIYTIYSISSENTTNKFFIITNPTPKYNTRVGEIIIAADDIIRPDTMLCDGRELNISDYYALFQVIGYKYCDREWDEKVLTQEAVTTNVYDSQSWKDHPDSAYTIIDYANKRINITNGINSYSRTVTVYNATNTKGDIVIYPKYEYLDNFQLSDGFYEDPKKKGVGGHFIVNDWTVRFLDNNGNEVGYTKTYVAPGPDTTSANYSSTYNYKIKSVNGSIPQVKKIIINAKTVLCWYNYTGHKNIKVNQHGWMNQGYHISYTCHKVVEVQPTQYKTIQHRNDPTKFRIPNIQNHLIQGGSTIDKIGTAYTTQSGPGGLQPHYGGTLPLNFFIFYQ